MERGEDFNLIWTGYSSVQDILQLNKYQKINHFPESINLGRKDMFWTNLLKMKKLYPRHFDVTPHSWILPADYAEFEKIRKQTA